MIGTELLLVLAGFVAGGFGALLGLGGGILIVPILTLIFEAPLHTAIGTSLVSVIATSAGGSAHNVRTGRADIRLGMTLAMAAVVGAFVGGTLAGVLPERALAGLFAALLAWTAVTFARGLMRPYRTGPGGPTEPTLDPTAADGAAAPPYRRRRLPAAFGGSFLAGNISGLLGVGGGSVTVPLIHLVQGAPLHVAVATSNFIIGITAAAGAYAYLFRGDVDPSIAGPVVLGVAVGAAGGARLAARLRATWLSVLFLAVVTYTAVEMALRAIGGP